MASSLKSRLDFTSRSTGLGVELKYLRSRADLERGRQEVLVDESIYQLHAYIETVAVLIYGPQAICRRNNRPHSRPT